MPFFPVYVHFISACFGAISSPYSGVLFYNSIFTPLLRFSGVVSGEIWFITGIFTYNYHADMLLEGDVAKYKEV